jgi:hypothetical protein
MMFREGSKVEEPQLKSRSYLFNFGLELKKNDVIKDFLSSNP